MTKLEAVTEAIYDALSNHHRINWSQAETAARAALACIVTEDDDPCHGPDDRWCPSCGLGGAKP